ncbi:hypothetical protein [Ruegeria aquimaris]|uniref:Uncharacterized protein n=1 Tax=Ruegeria aquimaris TaxID=2984333 RepID=A0ABT3AI52_9RHOB|nr:hypothetical protein [Ruegeria sp. XHP0148]MCV2888329.1 hypothetical protein [Ruegeria sp. XHP0148]
MNEPFNRESVAILSSERSTDRNLVSASVRLRFSLAGQESAHVSQIVVSVALTAEEGQPWRRIRRQIFAKAWAWLDQYFEGACLETGDPNLFSDVFAPDRNGRTLSPELERSLQRDLRQIERELAL